MKALKPAGVDASNFDPQWAISRDTPSAISHPARLEAGPTALSDCSPGVRSPLQRSHHRPSPLSNRSSLRRPSSASPTAALSPRSDPRAAGDEPPVGQAFAPHDDLCLSILRLPDSLRRHLTIKPQRRNRHPPLAAACHSVFIGTWNAELLTSAPIQ